METNPSGIDVVCPHCETEWTLEPQEAREGEFKCSECSTVFPISRAMTRRYLRDIRNDTSYPVLRSVIDISFIIDALLVVLAAIYFLATNISSAGSSNLPLVFVIIISAIVLLVLMFAARESALLLIDVADALIEQGGRNSSKGF